MRTHQHTLCPRLPLLTGTVLLGLAVLLHPGMAAAAGAAGEQIYRQQCASCHGMSGEGSDDYPHALAGDRSPAQLARFIARTMPKGAPRKCTGPDADKVAAYIYDAFYSRAAQARNRPPRIELSRLTVRQYRNAVADLVGSFRAPGHWDQQRGLRGEYFKSGGAGKGFKGFPNGQPALERLDPVVRFDFGVSSPDRAKLGPDRFSIRWQGSVLAPETGEYEFIVRTEHALRLWVNDTRQPLIDGWVKSGSDTEHRASIFLLGGRAYPLRLEFSKGKQGVADQEKKKKGPAPAVKASISLEWKPPHQAVEVIPARNLSPQRFPVTFVAETPFPPDDRSTGYERGTSVSRAWDRATTEAALEVAGYVLAHLRELAGVVDGAPDRGPRLRAFCRRFAERAFRRPLTAEQVRFFVERQFERAHDPEKAVKRVVLLVLMSPQFLYRDLGGGRDPYDVAARISFGLWDSLPDQELLGAAAAGQLATREQVVRQAERMLGDLRARSKLRAFFLQWLKVDAVPDLAKDPKRFPGFDPALVSDLRTSLDLSLEDVVWSEASDFRQLLLGDSLYLNGRLAPFYGVDLPPDAPFRKVSLQPGERAGVLSHPYLMAAFAYTGSSSPIHRGVLLARNILGRTLRPPPEAFTPLAPEMHPDLTTRQRVALQTNSPSCQVCHGVINPLGFTLEHFDAVGRYRDNEGGRPLDVTGGYQTRTGAWVKLAGARGLATFLAGSEEVHEAFVERLFHHLVQQPVRAFGPRRLSDLRQAFARDQFNVRKLALEIITATALTGRADSSGEDGGEEACAPLREEVPFGERPLFFSPRPRFGGEGLGVRGPRGLYLPLALPGRGQDEVVVFAGMGVSLSRPIQER